MKPIVRWNLWQRRWSMLWWCLGVFAFIFINLIFYPSFRNQASQYDQLFSQIPNSAKTLITDTGDFLSPQGYLSSQVFYLTLPMLLAILMIGVGASLIGKEERENTVELLLSRPISRTRLVAAKALTGLLILILVGLVAALTVVIMSKVVDLAIPAIHIFEASLATIWLALSFGAVAFMITTLGRGARTAAVGIASLVAIAGYVLASLAGTVHWLKWPSKAFPFSYYKPGEILNGNWHWFNFLMIGVFIVVCAVISVSAFRRRDIST